MQDGDDEDGSNAGAVYILEDKNSDSDYADSGEVIKVNKTQNTGENLLLDSGDSFGSSVATDGTRIFVGAGNDDDGGSNAGALYILEDTNNDGDYADDDEIIKVSDTQNTGESFSLAGNDNFGRSVATDGIRIFVGAGNDDDGGDNAGALYILEDMNNDNDYADSGEITKVTESSSTDSTFLLDGSDLFGSSVATDGTTIFVGAPEDDDSGDNRGAIYTFSLEKTFNAALTPEEMHALDAVTVTVTATTITDRAGNSGTGSETTFVYDVEKTAPILSSPSSIGTTSDNTPEFTFTSDEAGTILYGGDCTSTDTEALAEANTITFSALSDGEHSTCTVTVRDAADNDSAALAIPTFTIDTTAPVISAIALANDVTDGYLTGSETANTNNLITAPTVTGEPVGATTYKLTEKIETSCASFSDYTATIPQSADVASDGIYKICAKAADTFGNTGYRNAPLFIRDTAGPTMSFNSISDGTVDSTEDDTDIPITGENLHRTPKHSPSPSPTKPPPTQKHRHSAPLQP